MKTKIEIMTKLRFLFIVLVSFISISLSSTEISFHYKLWFLSKNNDQDYLSGLENKELSQKIFEWLGTPYRSGSNSKNGTDCSGFVQMVYREVYNRVLLRSSSMMITQVKKRIKNIEDLREGDLLFFKIWRHRISHVGIYLKNGMFVHASTSNGVEIASLNDRYYHKTFFRGGRVAENLCE